MKVYIASDHAGFELKQKIIEVCQNIQWVDLGPQDKSSVDYPDFAAKVQDSINQVSRSLNPGDDALKAGAMGVLICSTGQGMAIKANRSPLVRAALCWDKEVAYLAREHNNANVLCMGAKFVSIEKAQEIIKTFLETPFAGGRHQARIEKLR